MNTLFNYTPKKNFTLIDAFIYQHDKLMEEFVLKKPERTLYGIPIYFDAVAKTEIKCSDNNIDIGSTQYNSKILHVCSSSRTHTYIINCRRKSKELCTNASTDSKNKTCDHAIYYIKQDGEERKMCMERINKLHWIPKIVEFVNNNEGCVVKIDDFEYTYLYYKNNNDYYKIVFHHKDIGKSNETYYFTSAYPVTLPKEIRKINKFFQQ